MENGMLDAKDTDILRAIKDHARMSFTDIGEKVGLSRVAVKNRMEQMEKCGVITGYKTEMNFRPAQSGVHFIITIETTPDYFEEVAERLSYEPRIKQIYSLTGPSTLFAMGFAMNAEDAGHFVRVLTKNMRGMVKVDWSILASTIKDVSKGVDYVRIKREEQTNSKPDGQPAFRDHH